MTKRWNPSSGQYEPFSPGERLYPSLNATQRTQVDQIEPSSDRIIQYFPCRVRVDDHTWIDHVIIAEASEYIRMWGVWPDQDSGKREVKIEGVQEIRSSPSRLPLRFAKQLYDAGESGMGSALSSLNDGQRLEKRRI